MSGPSSLAQRNLLRHLTFELPSGQAIARAMGLDPLEKGDLADLNEFGFAHSTPLWFYVLREADKEEDGLKLGPVGGRIVAEVFVGLLQGDDQSYLSQEPTWNRLSERSPGSSALPTCSGTTDRHRKIASVWIPFSRLRCLSCPSTPPACR